LFADEKCQRTDLDAIALVKLGFFFVNPKGIDKSAVGAVAITDEHPVAVGSELTMSVTDVWISGPKLAIVVSSHSKGESLNGDNGSFALPSIDHKSPFHVAPPGSALVI
jgi:hypothetical protein